MAKAKYKRQKDGRFQTKAWDGTYEDDGSKHYKALYSTKSSGDLERQVNDLRSQVANRDYVQLCDDTFIGYARQWRKVYKMIRAKGTQAMYDNVIEKHFTKLGPLSLQKIQKLHFQLLINSAIDHPRLCQQIALTFRQVIAAAIDDNKLPQGSYKSICDKISLPKYAPNEKRPLTPEEKDAIKVADFTPMERAFVLMIYGTGVRRGEALALTKEAVDLKHSVVAINVSLAFDGNDPYIKETKNHRKRTVPLPGYLKSYLEEYMNITPGEYLFHKRDGSKMTKSSYVKMWESIERKINQAAGGNDNLQVVFGLTAHVFRHNYCANLCYQVPKVSIKKIAELMGDTEQMVIEVYSHIVEDKEDTNEAVEAAVGI